MTVPTRRPKDSVIIPLYQADSIHIEMIRCALNETRAAQWNEVIDDGSAHNVVWEQSALAGAMREAIWPWAVMRWPAIFPSPKRSG